MYPKLRVYPKFFCAIVHSNMPAIAPVPEPQSIPSSHELLFRQHAPKVQAHPN